MTYSVQNLTLVADCDVLLALAAKERADLDFKRLSDERLREKFAESSIAIDAELQGVIAELAAVETVLATLPEGQVREDTKDRKTRLEFRKFTLENRRETSGTVALLGKEMDIERTNGEIAEVDGFIAAIDARKTAIISQPPN